jgi:Holliday junction resolvase
MDVRQKGKRFERHVAKLISDKFEIACKRTPCSGGLSFKGDIISLSGIAARFNWECKNQESLNIWKALKQSDSDSISKVPVVVFTKNNESDYAALKLNDFLDLLAEIVELQENEEDK